MKKTENVNIHDMEKAFEIAFDPGRRNGIVTPKIDSKKEYSKKL